MLTMDIARIETRLSPTCAGFHHLKWYYIVEYKRHGLISDWRSWSFDALTAYPYRAQDRQRTGYQRKQRD
jgi:hypothetical protein